MPKKPTDQPERDPMAGEVDRLLQQLDPVVNGGGGPSTAPPASRPRIRIAEPPSRLRTLPSPLGVWGRVLLVAVLVAAMLMWPYRVCGWPLVGYFLGTVVTLVAGGWAAYASWRRRMAPAHVLAIVLIFMGVGLVAGQVLPRMGFSPVEVTWGCTP